MKRSTNFRGGSRRHFSREGYLAAWHFLHERAMYFYLRAMSARTL